MIIKHARAWQIADVNEALCINYIPYWLKDQEKTSTIIKANTLAMHGPLAKIDGSRVNRWISRDQSLIQYRWIYKLIKSNLSSLTKGVERVKNSYNNDNKLNS